MAHLTDEQLDDLTKRMNKRRAELERGLARLSPGEVRMAHDVLWEWGEREDEEIVEEYANARQQAYDKGWKDGRISRERELAILNGIEADAGRLVTNSAPEPEDTGSPNPDWYSTVPGAGVDRLLYSQGGPRPRTLGQLLAVLRLDSGFGIVRAAEAVKVSPTLITALERDADSAPAIVGDLLQLYVTGVIVRPYDKPAPDATDADPLDDNTDVDPGPDFDGGFYTRTPAGHTVHINGDPNMPEEAVAALGELADAVYNKMAAEATARYGHLADAGEQVPPTAALIEHRQPTDAEIARGLELERQLREQAAPAAMDKPGDNSESEPKTDDGYFPDPDPDGSIADAAYREAVEELVGKEALENGPYPPSARAGVEIGSLGVPIGYPSTHGPGHPEAIARDKAIRDHYAQKDAPPKSDEKLTWVELSGDDGPRPSGVGRESLADAIADFTNAPKEQVIQTLDGMGIGREPAPISDAAAATLGPENVVVTPLVPRRTMLPHPSKARENVAAARAAANGEHGFDLTHAGSRGTRKPVPLSALPAKALPKGKNGNVLPTLEQIVALIKEIAMGGVMPTMAAFDVARPGNWAAATAQLQRLGLSWNDLQKETGLAPNPRGARSTQAA